MAIECFEKGSNQALSPNFNLSEFDCRCTRPECDYTLVDLSILPLLEKLREKVGHPLIITSGYRCEKHQKILQESGIKTAAGRSQHCEGRAVDCRVRHFSSEQLEAMARAVGFMSIGVAPTFVHLDLRTGWRRWLY